MSWAALASSADGVACDPSPPLLAPLGDGSLDDARQQVDALRGQVTGDAAIETARAGEGGRRFVGVAAEVRDLARRSAESAGEISTMLQ